MYNRVLPPNWDFKPPCPSSWRPTCWLTFKVCSKFRTTHFSAHAVQIFSRLVWPFLERSYPASWTSRGGMVFQNPNWCLQERWQPKLWLKNLINLHFLDFPFLIYAAHTLLLTPCYKEIYWNSCLCATFDSFVCKLECLHFYIMALESN